GFSARLRLPEALVFLGMGYVLGPATHLFPEKAWANSVGPVSQLALGLVVYFSALSFSLKDTFESSLSTLALSLLGFVTAVTVGCFSGCLFQPYPTAFFAGLCVAALGFGPVRSYLAANRCGAEVEEAWGREALWVEGLAVAVGLACLAG